MPTRRPTVLRRTAVGPGDPRIAGEYQRVQTTASVEEWCRFFAPVSRSAVVCTGLLDKPGRVDFASLVDLARVRPDGDLGVDAVDLLAAIGLRGEAEVVIFTDQNGRQVAAPVRAIVGSGSLLLNLTDCDLSASPESAIDLSLPGWTDPDVPFHPVALHAVSFSEFVQCQ